MNPDAEIIVEMRVPKTGQCIRSRFKISEYIFAESIAPLPSDREIMPESAIRAIHQRKLRADICRDLGMRLAASILEFAEKQDPQMGYSPQEWDAIKKPAP